MSSFGQFASTTQFYLYGRQYCTADGFKRNMKKFYEGGKVKDILKDSKMSLEGKVAMVTGANSGVVRAGGLNDMQRVGKRVLRSL